MLDSALMRSLLALALVAATPVAASAGTYIGLGLGTQANASDSWGNWYTANGRSDRLMLGTRFGNFSIEGAYTGQDMLYRTGAGIDSRTLGLDGKLSLPLGDNFEAFGRVGLIRTWLSPQTADMATLSGDGYMLSAGFEYRLNLGIGAGSLFVDYTRNSAKLDGGPKPLDQVASMWTLGILLAI